MSRFYILEYTDRHPGCPTYPATELNHPDTEWPHFVAAPSTVAVTKEYVLQVTDPEIRDIAFDMEEGNQPCVSREFLDVCDRMNVPYRAIPVKIVLTDGSEPAKAYAFFLPGASLSLLDRTASKFKEEMDLETGGVQYNGVYTVVPIYAEINRFVPKNILTPPLFFCPEIFELVCTDAFRVAGEKLLGVEYVPLDDSYRYVPWDDPW